MSLPREFLMVASTPTWASLRTNSSGALLSGGLEPGVLKVVQLNEIDVSKGSSREVAECLELSVVVVHTTDKGVLVRRPSARGLNVLPMHVVEALQRVLLDAGHDRVSGRLNGGVKGDGKRELGSGSLEKASNHGDDTAGRYREVTSADSRALGRVQHAEGLDDLIVVIEGLALAIITTLEARVWKSSLTCMTWS